MNDQLTIDSWDTEISFASGPNTRVRVEARRHLDTVDLTNVDRNFVSARATSGNSGGSDQISFHTEEDFNDFMKAMKAAGGAAFTKAPLPEQVVAVSKTSKLTYAIKPTRANSYGVWGEYLPLITDDGERYPYDSWVKQGLFPREGFTFTPSVDG